MDNNCANLPCFGAYNTHIFHLRIISNWGLCVIHYNKQNHVFYPLKISRKETKRVTCSERVGVFSYKRPKFSHYNLNFSHHPISTFIDFLERTFCINFDTKSVFVNSDSTLFISRHFQILSAILAMVNLSRIDRH